MISMIGSQSSPSAERKLHGGRIVCRFTAEFPKSSTVPDTGKVQNPTICRVAGWMGEERLWLNQPINILFCDTHPHPHPHTPTHTHTHTHGEGKEEAEGISGEGKRFCRGQSHEQAWRTLGITINPE